MRAVTFLSLIAAGALPSPAAAQPAAISGTVVSQGRPVSGAKVWLRYYTTGASATEKLIQTTSDSAGRFRVIAPEQERSGFELIARAGDGRLGWLSLGWEGDTDHGDVVLELLAVGEARGRFTDTQGKPLSGTRVEVKSFYVGSGKGFSRERSVNLPNELAKAYEAASNRDGVFVVRGVPLGANVYATASPAGFGELGIGWSQSTTAEFRLDRPGRLRIRFTGADDVPKLADLPLNLFIRSGTSSPDAGQFINLSRELKAKGADTLEVDNLLPGAGELRFYSAPDVPYVPKTLPKLVVKPGEVAEVSVAVEPAAKVTGRVIDRKTRAGVAGASVLINGHDRDGEHRSSTWVKAGVEGRFAAYVRPGRLTAFVHGLPAGYARAVRDEHSGKPVEVAARLEHTFADILLDPAVPIEGIVVDEAGRPVAGAIVYSAGGDWTLRGRDPRTDDKGRFVLKTLGGEDLSALRTRTPRAVTDGAIALDMAQAKPPLKLVVSEKLACRFTGRLVDGAGTPVVGAAVRVMLEYRAVGVSAGLSTFLVLETHRSGADGRFQTAALWPGDRYRVEITAPGYSKILTVPRQGEAGQVHDIGTITLARTSAVVRGVVVDAAGKPLAGVKVFNQGDAPKPLSTTTGGDGRFELTGLFEGPCLVFARKSGYRFTMARVDGKTLEARITLLASSDPPPVAEQPLRTKEHIAAERKLAAHLLDKLLALPEEVTGRYRVSVFECLVQTDLPRGKRWLAEERLRNPAVADVKAGYSRVLHIAEARRAAASDAQEALTALAPVPAPDAVTTLLELGERFLKSDPARALRFVEEAVARARMMQAPPRAPSLARAGDLVVRIGRPAAGKKLLAEAADLAEQLGVERLEGVYRAETACPLGGHDLPRARLLLDPLLETDSRNVWLSRLADHLARSDAKAALALLGEMTPDRGFVHPQTQMRIACRVAERDPAEAVRIAEGISSLHYRSQAFVYLAGVVAPRDRKLAWSLIDRSLAIYLDDPEAFRSWSNFGGRSTLAAWTAVQAHAVGHPDMAGVIARVLACRPDELEYWSSTAVLETNVRMAKLLALVDPAAARHLLERVTPREHLLGTGSTGFRRQDWLLARCLADPARAAAWIDAAIAKLDPSKDETAFYDSGLLQLTQTLTVPPERRLRAVLGLNSGLDFPDKD